MFKEKDIQRFWKYVHKTENCWEWSGYVGFHGYGEMTIEKKNWGCHRVSWIIHFGEIPIVQGKSLSVCHHCDNPICIDPNHLFVGTTADNMRDAQSKGRYASGERHHNYNKKIAPTYDRKKTPEQLEKIRASLVSQNKGENNHNYGKKASEEAKLRMRQAKLGKYVGEKSHTSKLKDSQRKEIYRKYHEVNGKRGILTSLAKEYGIDLSTIYPIVKNELWA